MKVKNLHETRADNYFKSGTIRTPPGLCLKPQEKMIMKNAIIAISKRRGPAAVGPICIHTFTHILLFLIERRLWITPVVNQTLNSSRLYVQVFFFLYSMALGCPLHHPGPPRHPFIDPPGRNETNICVPLIGFLAYIIDH